MKTPPVVNEDFRLSSNLHNVFALWPDEMQSGTEQSPIQPGGVRKFTIRWNAGILAAGYHALYQTAVEKRNTAYNEARD